MIITFDEENMAPTPSNIPPEMCRFSIVDGFAHNSVLLNLKSPTVSLLEEQKTV